AGTVELAALVLRDSGKLQQEAAKDRARWRRKHPDEAAAARPGSTTAAAGEGADPEEVIRRQPPEVIVAADEPLYAVADVGRPVPQLRILEYEVPRVVAPGVTATLLDAGHNPGPA